MAGRLEKKQKQVSVEPVKPVSIPKKKASKFGDFSAFADKIEKKSSKRKPVRTKAKITGTLFAKRNLRVSIRESALRGVSVIILYKKVTTNEVKRYEAICLSYRYRRTKLGLRKVLFLQDYRDGKQVKYFVMRNIIKVSLTDRKVKADWPIEIK